MCTCKLIQRLKHKASIHQRLSLAPEDKAAWQLKWKGGSGIKTMIHVSADSTIHGEKWFKENH